MGRRQYPKKILIVHGRAIDSVTAAYSTNGSCEFTVLPHATNTNVRSAMLTDGMSIGSSLWQRMYIDIAPIAQLVNVANAIQAKVVASAMRSVN